MAHNIKNNMENQEKKSLVEQFAEAGKSAREQRRIFNQSIDLDDYAKAFEAGTISKNEFINAIAARAHCIAIAEAKATYIATIDAAEIVADKTREEAVSVYYATIENADGVYHAATSK